jgi:integrase
MDDTALSAVTTPAKVAVVLGGAAALAQSLALLDVARESRLNAYVVLSLTVGIRTEEARELRWDHVDLDGDPGAVRSVPPSMAVWWSVRQGGDTKTAKSRRTLALPRTAVQALRDHRRRQAEDRLSAGAVWEDHGLVFASAVGTPLDAANVRREFRKITEAAGLGAGWAPRDLRHTFVSLMLADGVPIEEIARLAGHNRTATIELVYRHEASCHHHGRRGNGSDLVTGKPVEPVERGACSSLCGGPPARAKINADGFIACPPCLSACC